MSNINLSKNEGTETNEVNNSVEATKAEQNNNVNIEKVREAEENISNQLEGALNNVTDEVSKVFNRVTDSFNNAVNEENSPTQQFQSEQPTVNLNKQPDFSNGQQFNNGQQQFNNKQPDFSNGQQFNNGQQQFNRQQNASNNLKVTPTVAAILSVLLTGLGQMLNGQLLKGITMLVVGFIATFIITIFTCGIGAVIAVPVVWIVSGLDAYNCAKILEAGGTLGEWEMHILN